MPKHTSSSAIVEPNGTTGAPPHPLFDTVHDHSGANEEQKRSPPPAFAIDDSEASSLSSPFSLRSHKLRQAQFAVFQSFPPSSGGLSGPGVTPELGGSGRTGYFTVPEDAEGEALFGPLPGSGTRGWSAYPSPSLPLHAEPQQPAVQHVERGEAASPLHGVKRSISPEERRRLKEQYGLKEEQQAKLERLLGAVWGSASAGEAKRFGEVSPAKVTTNDPSSDGANSPLAPSSPLANRRDLGHSNKNAALPDSPPATTSSQRSERRRREQQQSTTIESVLADATPRPGDPLTGRSTRMNGEEPFFTPSVAKHLADEEAQVPSAPSRSPRPFPQTYPDGHSPRIVITTPLHSPRAKTLASPGASNRSSPRPASLHLSPPPSVDYDDPPRQQTTSPAISPPTSPQAERTLTPFPTPPPFFAPSFPDPYYTRPSNFRQLGYDFLPSRSGVRVSNHRGYVDGEMSQEEREWTERTRRVPNDGGLKDWWGNPVGERGQWGRAVLSPIVTETEPTHSSPSLSLNRSPHLHHFRPIAFPSSPLAERLRSLSTPPQPAPLSASTSSVSASPAARQPHSPVERYLSNSPLANGVVSPAADEAGEGLDGVRPLDTRRRDPLATEHPPSSGGGRGPSLGSATPSSASTPRLANSTPQPAAAIYSHSSGTALAEAQPKVRSASASIASPPGQALANARSSIASPVVQPQERLTTASPPSVSASKVEQISSWARGVHGEEGGDARRSWEGQPGDETVETERRRGLQPYSDGVTPRGPDFAGEGGQLSMDALLPNRPAGAISPPLHNFHSSAFSPPRSPSKRSSSSRRVADPVLGFADGGKHLDAFSDPASLDEHETQRQQMRGIDERFRSAYSSSDLGASEPVFLEHGNGAFSPSSFAAGGSRRPLRPYRRGPFPVPQLSEEEKEERRRLRKLGRSPEFELDLSETKAELRKRAWKEQQAFEKQKNHLLGLLGEQPSRADVPVYNALARLHLATTVPASRALAQQYLLSSLAMDEAQPDMAHLLALELEHRDLQEAVHWHRIALRYGAEQPEYHLYLASALTRAGDVDSALDVYAGLSHGFLETPYEALALFHLGRLHHDYGRPEERASVDEAYHAALETLQRLRLMDPALRRGDRWDKLDELEQVVLASLAELEEEKRGEKSPVKESASNGVFSPATARRPPSSLRPTSPPLHGFRSPSAPPAVGPKSALRNGSGSASSPKRSSFRGGQRSAADSALPARQPLPDPRLYYDGHEAVLRPGGSVGYIPPEPVRPEQGRRSRAVSASRHGAGQHHRASSRTSSRTLEVIIYSLRTMADSDGPEQLYRSTRQLAEEVEETYETIKHLGQSDREKERELVGSLDELKTELEALPERLVSAAKLPPPTQDPLRAAREKLEKARRSFLK
ncbi:hypothetical protein JCM10213v2_007433 [Rhodosporidiobolus nylandii]